MMLMVLLTTSLVTKTSYRLVLMSRGAWLCCSYLASLLGCSEIDNREELLSLLGGFLLALSTLLGGLCGTFIRKVKVYFYTNQFLRHED